VTKTQKILTRLIETSAQKKGWEVEDRPLGLILSQRGIKKHFIFLTPRNFCVFASLFREKEDIILLPSTIEDRRLADQSKRMISRELSPFRLQGRILAVRVSQWWRNMGILFPGNRQDR